MKTFFEVLILAFPGYLGVCLLLLILKHLVLIAEIALGISIILVIGYYLMNIILWCWAHRSKRKKDILN